MEQHRNESVGEKWEIPKKTRRPAASSGTISTCENLGENPPGIELGSPRLEAGSLTTGLVSSAQKVVAQWSDYLPPTLAKRVRFLAGSHPVSSRVGIVLDDIAGRRFSRVVAFRRCSMTHLASPSSALKTSMLMALPTSCQW
ncbi:hypothetical protein PR048_021196 [Dryococelus australis]|uniref:Uncharacterized protein n=1 Tax=Dryococelus australis TaxID=614101 RepID=A0ABQ9GXM6_9NEOP|nr:hypothetical protein PR048_021196 [Dryococelus australis]